ncbi:MAG: hypothetical protein J2P22_14235 [Nocardioides sp.]|nr:hypothetical protein [Nocardioides sp.]
MATVGAGLGVILLPEAAHAANIHCCKDSTCPTCSGPPVRYRCTSSCFGNFCTCHADVGQCFTEPCVAPSSGAQASNRPNWHHR